MSNAGEQHILSAINNGIQKVTINRPLKKNAFSPQMYQSLTNIITNSSTNNDVIALVITGNGNFFTSGNDLTPGNSSETDGSPFESVKKLIDALILYPKLLIAIVNGPAIGIGMTSLSLFDIVYASEQAYFQTPFSKIGFSSEGCSSYTFPLIFGPSKASEILYLNYKLSAEEAWKRGFVSKLYNNNDIDQIWSELEEISSLSSDSILASKKLVRQWNKETLLRVNEEEIKVLNETVSSEKFAEHFMKYLKSKKSSL